MKESKNWVKIAGGFLHIVIGGLMIFTGAQKILGLVPPEALAKYGLGEEVRLIGVGAVLSALFLLIPRTSSLGILLTSAFWGGTICIHMAHGEPYVFQSVALVLSWVGAYLRHPTTLGSFSGPHGNSGGGRVGSGRAATGPGVERWPGLLHYEHGAGI
jgi:hypothetical protein